MFTVVPITSLEDPALAPYRTLKRYPEHRREGFFVAEGEKVVRRLLESPLEVVSVVLPHRWQPEFEPLLARRPETIRLYVGAKELLEQLVGFVLYQGVMAIARVPEPRTLESVVASRPPEPLLLAVEEVSNADNIGTLVRTTAAMGGTGFLVGETSSSPFLRRAVRSSMGAVFRLPVVELEDLRASLIWLGEQGVRCVAAHPHADHRVLSSVDLTGPVCIVLGSEGEGISPGILKACTLSVAIPMANEVDSLNVAAAGAAFLYEAARQRRAPDPGTPG